MPLSSSLTARLGRILSPDRVYTDPVSVHVYALDASIYTPRAQAVVDVHTEDELIALLHALQGSGTGLTMRGSGTSLNGQATGEGVIARLRGEGWRSRTVLDAGQRIRLGCGVLCAEADSILAAHGRRIGPDPASAAAASIGGMVANNAAGMCCTVAQNTFATMRDLRVILPDGAVLDTADPESVAAFRVSHAHVLSGLSLMRERVLADPEQVARIRRKYSIKNTTGYAMNALTEYADPVDILTHLMVGSEGTLGVVTRVTLETLPVLPLRATALLLFPDLDAAARAVMALRHAPVQAAELLDRTALHAVEHLPGAPPALRELGPDACAVLLETRALDCGTLAANTRGILTNLEGIAQLTPPDFSTDPAQCERLWSVRRGLFSAVSSYRAPDEFVITEDINIPVERLAEGCAAFQELFARHGYRAGIMGHALHGNFHFTLPTPISDPAEVRRLHRFLDDLATVITRDFDGSLKAEHGTGRAIAPYVRLEWGNEIYAVMVALKQLLDPHNVLNPGVMFDESPAAHVQGLKKPHTCHAGIDMCVDCGFCEPVCPSRHIAFTPRQRIAAWREIRRLENAGHMTSAATWHTVFAQRGNATCATDGLCATRCPLGIDVAAFIRDLRHDKASPLARESARMVGNHFAATTEAVRTVLGVADLAHATLGPDRLEGLSRVLTRLSRNRLPQWMPQLPRPAAPLSRPVQIGNPEQDVVVYLPSCAVRTLGDTRPHPREPLPRVTVRLLERAGYTVRIPDHVDELCCGKAFETKGLYRQAKDKIRTLEAALRTASDHGRHPILCDTSPCLARMKKEIRGLRLYEPVEFAQTFLLPRLRVRPVARRVAVHPTCSTRTMGLTEELITLVGTLAAEAMLPEGILCCGFSGDKGFHLPELNASALAGLATQVAGCAEGYSTSRTCEIGLTRHSGIEYVNLLYLLEEGLR